MLSRLKGWRTIIFNLANAIVVVFEVVQSQYAIPENVMPYWLAIYVVGNIVLRLMTDTKVGKAT